MLKINSYYAGKLYMTNDRVEINNVEKFTKQVSDEEEMFYCTTNLPNVITYGCKQLVDNYQNKAGYIWASRPGCVNKEWGTRYIECYIDNSCYAIDVDYAAELLKNFAEEKKLDNVDVRVRSVKETDEDTAYAISLYSNGKYMSEL